MLLPEGYARLFVAGEAEPIGAVTAPIAGALGDLAVARADGWGLPEHDLQARLDAAVERLLAAGLCSSLRGEAIAVRAGRDGPALARVDRAAAEALGLLVRKVCLVGIVQRDADGEPPCVWLARRGDDQRTAPGLLDTTVAGGVPAGADDGETLRAEAWEEASLAPERLEAARFAARLDRLAPGPRGLSREDLLVWELSMTPDERPTPRDDEIAGFEPWPLPDLAQALIVPRDFKPGAAIVLRDALARLSPTRP